MRGLRKYLTPFAPDQSGAVSVCYALGGIVVIVDAGGCAGNICGFDEPRWQRAYSGSDQTLQRVQAVFSAGLRDMDAILGRDDVLIRKLKEASGQIDAKFIALIGTPVPAVIGTDLRSLSAICERVTDLPCIAVSTDGMHLYDRGIEETLLELVKRFGKQREPDGKERRICGVLGLNVLDLFDMEWTDAIHRSLLERGYDEVLLYGMKDGLQAFERCSYAQRNYVVSPAGIAAAKYLEERYQIPYEVSFPADPMQILEENACVQAASFDADKKVLIVHQQVLGNSIRDAMENSGVRCEIIAASWFDQKEELMREGDLSLREEDDFIELVRERHFDLIIADPALRPMAPSFSGRWIDAYHFAVSGQAAIDQNRKKKGM